jgi:DNA end-binding protein Ku
MGARRLTFGTHHASIKAMAKKKSKAKPRSKFRASWRGNLTFGLVSFPVQAINAINREGSDIHFHQLHSVCHRRIHYAKICPVHGEVPNDEIVSGYEHKKGKYVEVDPEELDALRTQSERSLTIDAFVPPDTIDPLYFDGRMYYLVPANETAEEPYEVIAQAMEKEERVGIGPVVMSGKDQLALVRPANGLLHMAMLNFDEEIRLPKDLGLHLHTKSSAAQRRKVQLAQTLIRGWAVDDFDFDQYDDQYREKVQALIKAKVAGREIVAPEEEEETPEVVNLMDALKRSVEATKPKPASRKRRRA